MSDVANTEADVPTIDYRGFYGLYMSVVERAFAFAARRLEERGIEAHHALISLVVLEENSVTISLTVLSAGVETRYRFQVPAISLDTIPQDEIELLGAQLAAARHIEDLAAYRRVTASIEGV